MHKHLVTIKGPQRVTTLRDTKPGDFFIFVGKSIGGLEDRGLMIRLWSDADEPDGAYAFAQVSNAQSTWNGAKDSTLLDNAVRVLQKGETFKVTIGGAL